MTYRYTIDGADVSPRGDWEIDYQKNAGQIFSRRVLTGDLEFQGDDYDLIMSSAECDVLEFKIYCGVTEYWEGKFKFPYDFDIDEDSCVAVGTPEVVDEYSCIMDMYEFNFDLILAGVGGVTPDLHSCGGGLLHTFPASAYLLGMPSPAGATEAFLNRIINGTPYMNCGLTLRSSFLWEDDFPNGTNYAGAYGGNNYITGAANHLADIRLLRTSAVRSSIGGSTCTPTDVNNFTFKEFETLLRDRFNAYWYIDQNGHFRIEHIYFFDTDFPESDFEVDIDLTSLVSSNGKTFAYRRNKYTYETGELYDQEHWTWQYYEGTEGTVAHGADFEGVPIFYGAAVNDKSDCVPGVFKEKDVATPRFWSDIFWAFSLIAATEPDTIGCDGYVILDVDPGTTDIVCETGVLSAANTQNAHLSTANLQDHYFQYDRIFIDGDMNSGDVTTFQTAQRTKLQEAIEFDWCCGDSFDPKELIRTELGTGRVKTAIHKKRSIEVELLY